MRPPTINALLDSHDHQGYKVFDKPNQDFNVNVVGVRNPEAEFNTYSCWMTLFWRSDGMWKLRKWPATTLPGKRFLVDRLLNSDGCAILVPGRYPAYQLSMHRGVYEALCQRTGEVQVYRDRNRNQTFDLDRKTIDTGYFGINIHAPVPPEGRMNYRAARVDASSAGCQVFQNVSDFLEFRDILRSSRSRYGNNFTYTLLNGLV